MEDFLKRCIILVEVPTRVSETRIETFLDKSDGLEDFGFIGQINAWFASYDDADNAQAAITKLQGLKLVGLKIEVKPCTEQIGKLLCQSETGAKAEAEAKAKKEAEVLDHMAEVLCKSNRFVVTKRSSDSHTDRTSDDHACAPTSATAVRHAYLE